MRGWGLSAPLRAQWLGAQVAIRSTAQFPSLRRDRDDSLAEVELAAALGVVRFNDGGGLAWFKGGHDEFTANFVLCQEAGRRCLLLMSNDVRAEAHYRRLAEQLLGPTRMPWRWEYPGF